MNRHTLAVNVGAIEAEVETQSPAGTGTSLVLASVYASEQQANKLWLAEHVGKLVTQKSRTKNTVRGDAYAAGTQFGGSIPLNTQLK